LIKLRKLYKHIKNENLIKYIDVQVEQSRKEIVLITEYVPGCSLKDIIARFGQLKETLLRMYLTQILNGLAYLHSKNLTHGNLKSSNILVDSGGKIKLSDYIRFKEFEDYIKKNSNFSNDLTSSWPAPELTKSELPMSDKVDIWELGILLLEMFLGKAPNSCDSDRQSGSSHEDNKNNYIPEIPNNLSLPMKIFMNACLVLNPEARASITDLIKLNDEMNLISKEETIKNKGEIMKQVNLVKNMRSFRSNTLTPIIVQHLTQVEDNAIQRANTIVNNIKKENDKNKGISHSSNILKKEKFNLEKKEVGKILKKFEGDLDTEITREILNKN